MCKEPGIATASQVDFHEIAKCSTSDEQSLISFCPVNFYLLLLETVALHSMRCLLKVSLQF